MSQQFSTHQWICFQIASETYAHLVENVQEVLNFHPPVPVPGAPPAVEGILNVRGEIVTVVCSRCILGLTVTENHVTEHIMVIQTNSGPIGVMVDQVQQIEELDNDKIESIETDLSNPIKGTVQHKNDLIIVTDFTRYLSHVERDQ